MLIRQTAMPLSHLQAVCQSIVTRLADDVRRGGNIETGYLIYRNQLQGFLLFASGTEGEPIVKHAQHALDAEYRCLKGLAGTPGD